MNDITLDEVAQLLGYKDLEIFRLAKELAEVRAELAKHLTQPNPPDQS